MNVEIEISKETIALITKNIRELTNSNKDDILYGRYLERMDIIQSIRELRGDKWDLRECADENDVCDYICSWLLEHREIKGVNK
jgi:hypothetical protein